MEYHYLIMPLLTWLTAGSTKFLINSVRARRLAFDQIGYGGMPSTHSTIVCGMAALIALKEGFGNPAFGAALCLCVIVMIDANSLRRQIGKHAVSINRLAADQSGDQLRERVGHTRMEILGGMVVGILCALALNSVA